MQVKHGCIGITFVTLALLPPSSLKADVIFSNLGAGTPVTTVTVSGTGRFPESWAAAFTPTADSTMNEAQVNVLGETLVPDQEFFGLSLYSDSSGLPGSPLETLGGGPFLPSLAAPLGMFGIVPSTGFAPIPLTGGTQYWLVMTPSNTVTTVEWASGGPDLNVPSAVSLTRDGSAPWIPEGPHGIQFEIDGTVPEPGTASLLAVGFGLATLASRLRVFRPHKS